MRTAMNLRGRDAELLRRYARELIRITRERGLTRAEREALPPLPEEFGALWKMAPPRERVMIAKMARAIRERG